MTKRIFAICLALALLLALMPQLTAEASQEQKVITVRQAGTIAEMNGTAGERGVSVYVNGFGDLLFSGEDLEKITGFTYEIDGKTASFTRGAKIVEVELSSGKIYPLKGIANIRPEVCISEPMQAGEQWYFSGGSLLPWLNVTCYEDNGVLVILPDEYSFWDSWGELDLGKYSIGYVEVATEFAWNSKVVKALNFTDKNIGKQFLEAVNYTDEYDGSVNDYFDMLECLLLDSTHSEYLADVYHDMMNNYLDVAGIVADDLGPIITAFKLINDGAYYAAQYMAYTQNHQDKMELVDQLLLVRGSYSKQLEDGALLLQNSYENWWDGILNKYVLNMDKYLVSEIQDKLVSHPIGKAILLAVDVETKEIQNLNTRISLLRPYINLYNVGCSGYRNPSVHHSAIKSRRSHAILALFAAGENLRTLSAYSEKHDRSDLASRYSSLAEECDMWIKELTAASMSEMNDSYSYWQPSGDDEGRKEDYTDKLLDVFEKLSFPTVASGGVEMVEYAMMADFMEYQPLRTHNSTVTKTGNGNGYVIYGAMAKRSFQLELDAATLKCRLYDSDEVPGGTPPDMTQVQLSGKTETLLKSMDDYFSQRENFAAMEAVDLNGDGKADRIYAVASSARMWLSRMEVHSVSGGDENPFGSDPMVTLVVAETAKSGLRVRVMRIAIPQEYLWSMDGTDLIVAGTRYCYTADGEDPFYIKKTTENTTTADKTTVNTTDMSLKELLLQPREKLSGLVSGYTDSLSSDGKTVYGEGIFNGATVDIRCTEQDGCFRVTYIEAIFGDEELAVTPDVRSTASKEDAQKQLQPTLPWDYKDTKSQGDVVYDFYSNFYYDFDTGVAWYVQVRGKTVWVDDAWTPRTFAGISFSYAQSLNENVPDWLIDSYN